MIRLDFHRPLTALEIRDPAVDVCKEVADSLNLFVTFTQRQQPALSGNPTTRGPRRERIGNGKHKDWHIDFQEDAPQVSKPSVIGRIALRAPVFPNNMQFGGFDYGKYGEEPPTYSFITVHTPTELEHYRPLDPNPELLDMAYQGLKVQFEGNWPRLFDIAAYDL